jgi:anaerobic ribonucleoside-triphosphate reductase activating protein
LEEQQKQRTINVAGRVPRTEAEGPGWRYALWVQGCPFRCPGCCNPHMLEDRTVELVEAAALADEIIATPGIEGLTCIGGEPFAQAGALAEVARRVRRAGLSVMVFTGFTIERIRRSGDADKLAFLDEIDLLVDGPFVEKLLVEDRRWIGSSNQRTHFLTDRYRHLSEEREGWDEESNTIEIRLSGGELSINGFPHDSIVRLSEGEAERRREDEA